MRVQQLIKFGQWFGWSDQYNWVIIATNKMGEIILPSLCREEGSDKGICNNHCYGQGSIYIAGYQLQVNNNFLQPAIRMEVYWVSLDPSSLQRGGNARLGRNYCATPYVINDSFIPPGAPELTNNTLVTVASLLLFVVLVVGQWQKRQQVTHDIWNKTRDSLKQWQ